MTSRSREFRKQRDQQASWDRLRTAPWSPLETRRAFASGHPRIQLVSLPSFSQPQFWEVCQLKSEWVLYSSAVINPARSALTLQGYEPVSFSGDKLKSYFERLTALTLPLAPDLSGMDGLDGTITQLALFGDCSSEVRYQWWSDHPPHWAPLVEIASEMFDAFGGAAPSK